MTHCHNMSGNDDLKLSSVHRRFRTLHFGPNSSILQFEASPLRRMVSVYAAHESETKSRRDRILSFLFSQSQLEPRATPAKRLQAFPRG